MKGIFIPEITVEMFRNGCLESIETLMTEGEVYDIEYDPKTAEPEIIRCKDCIKRETCRTTNIWAVPPDDNWYCADAERRTDE